MKKISHRLFGRIGITALFLLLQAAALLIIFLRFREYHYQYAMASTLLSLILVILILNNRVSPAYKISWIVLLMLSPFFGGLFYFLFSSDQTKKKFLREMQPITQKMSQFLRSNAKPLHDLNGIDGAAANQAKYLMGNAHCPVYNNTEVTYFKLGELKFQQLLKELRLAKRFIFMEYFIIEEGHMWGEILKVLKEKAAQGVDVRLIYDDFGTLLLLPDGYKEQLKDWGIKTQVFNPFTPLFSLRMNNRDHRKITVIDGHTAFNGGVNLADEYINHVSRFGHWKDTAIMLKGEAVWSFTVMFLTMWDYLEPSQDNFLDYMPQVPDTANIQEEGFILPYTDSPLDGEFVGESVYLNLIWNAKDYIYITTPYLVLDSEMINALTLAAKRGVDVRIITPKIGDKWYVHAMTRANYRYLLEDGVKIYEYTPGFIHAKMFVVDDLYGVIGTINLDYRSLYLHYECATWMYKTKAVMEMKEDIQQTLALSEEITLTSYHKTPTREKFLFLILRILAPFM
ncbi:MAG: cardiolipin synthase [Turicibacter sp.]|nr:cardiolipin synthase [Turicibacter sp.]